MRTQKKAWLAALLNLIPLVGVVAAIPDAIPLYTLFGITCFLPSLYRLLLCLALVVWGIGYLYLNRRGRFLFALCIPWLYCCGFTYAINSFLRPSSPMLPDFYVPHMAEGLVVIGVLNLLSGVDAWFLAGRQIMGIDAWFLGGRQGSHDQEKAPETMTGADKPNMIGLDDPTEREVARTLSDKTSSEKPSQEK